MSENYIGKIFLKAAIPALIAAAKELPVVGVPLRMGSAFFEKWNEELRSAQDALPEEQRPEQLEQAAALRPSEARALALELLANDKQGQSLDQEQREAVADVVAMIPARIKERTQATLMQAKRYGTIAQEVLPLSAKASTIERVEFYRNLLPASRPQFKPGDALPHGNPEWRLLQLIGTGGFGEVWRSRHDYLGEERAVKFCQNEAGSAILQREAGNLYHLRQSLPNHPHIVRLYDLQLKHQPFWLTFEYVQGGTLESLLRARGAIPWQEALTMIYPIWHAITKVHELGIIHRDLKPANILLNGKNVPKIADFGIGKVLAEQVDAADPQSRRSQGMTTRGYGSAGYMSPEQEEGQAAHPADDTYALAIILWQMLSGNLGRTPHYPKEVQALDAPDILKKIIGACRFSAREQRPLNVKLLPHLRQLVQPQSPRPTQQPNTGTTAPTLPPIAATPALQPVTATPTVEPAQEMVAAPTPSIEREIAPQDVQDAPSSVPQIESSIPVQPALASESLAPESSVASITTQDEVILDTAPKTSLPSDSPLLAEEIEAEVTDTDSNEETSEDQLTDATATSQPTTVVIRTEPHDHYIIHQDGTVTDTRSGLMWKRCAEGQIWDGTTCKKKESRITWNDCMPDGKQKSWPEFAGYNDWRLPTHEELRTLVYCSSGQPQTWHNKGSNKHCAGEYQQPTIDQAAFPNTPLATFWTTAVTNSDKRIDKRASSVSFKLGCLYHHGTTCSSPLRVRLVRGIFLEATGQPVQNDVIVEEPSISTESLAPTPLITVTESSSPLPAELQSSPLDQDTTQSTNAVEDLPETPVASSIGTDIEQKLRQDSRVQRFLRNQRWSDAANAAIAYYCHNTACSVASLEKSSTWQQIEMIYKETYKKDIEQKLRQDSRIQRLLRHKLCCDAANAAIAYYSHDVACPIKSWQKSLTWQQIESVYKEIVN